MALVLDKTVTRNVKKYKVVRQYNIHAGRVPDVAHI